MCPLTESQRSTQRPQARGKRADAVHNRQRILGVARAMLNDASAAEAITMQAVAKRAQVGQGTLYRHFPSWESLVLAVYETDVERLIRAAATYLQTCSAPEALRRWLIDLAAYGQLKRGVSEVVLTTAVRKDIAGTWRPRVLHAAQELLDAAQRQGEVRGDVDACDLWDLVSFLWITSLTPERAERLTLVVLDGLLLPKPASKSGNGRTR